MTIQYDVRPFANDMFIVTRNETRSIPVKGLPPTTSQCIIMEHDELEKFVETLQQCLQKMKSENSAS